MSLKYQPGQAARVVAIYYDGKPVSQLEGVQFGRDGTIQQIFSDQGGDEPCTERISIHIVQGLDADQQVYVQTYNNVGACVVCLDGEANTVFLHCGHLAACEVCAGRACSTVCPLCRAAVQQQLTSQILKGKQVCNLRRVS